MKASLTQASLLSVGQLPRQRWETETPTSNQSPCSDQGRKLLGPAALRTCHWALLLSQVRARLGAGGYCRHFGNRVPRLACLRPAAWLNQWPSTALFINQHSRPSRGAKPRGADDARPPQGRPHQEDSRGGGEIKARSTSQGAHDASHDDQDQAGASLYSVLVSSLVQMGQAQARSTECWGYT